MTTAPPAVAAPEGGGGPPYRIAYEISVDAFVDASRLALTWMRTRVLVISAIAAVTGVALLALVPDAPGLMLVFFAVILVAFTATSYPERWIVSRRAGDVVGTSVTLVVDVEGIEVSTASVAGRVAWAGLTEVQDDGRAVVFLRRRDLASWAPAAAFGQPERRAEIVAFARERIAATR